ncbi:MAG TPA: hypothetical protein DEB31_07055, partial [Clostridiales bacterium]|nr:hypothetical protein [Clostridiales bacterium]
MPARRFIYALFLSVSLFYYIFHTGYVSWILLVIAIALPVLSLLLTWLLFRGGQRISICSGAARTDGKKGISLSLKLISSSPSARARLRVTAENLFTGEKATRKMMLVSEEETAVPFEGKHCGVIRATVKRPRVLDLLGLIGLPVRADGQVEVLLLPKEIPFSGNPDALFPQGGEDQQKWADTGIMTREWKDIRDYREGDLLRDIHWKLTARRGKAVVREYEWAAGKTAHIAVSCGDTQSEAAQAVARFLGVAHAFLSAGFSLRVLWPAYENGQAEAR